MLEDLILEVETEDSYVQPQHCLSTFQVVFTHDEDSEYIKLPTNQPVGRLISFFLSRRHAANVYTGCNSRHRSALRCSCRCTRSSGLVTQGGDLGSLITPFMVTKYSCGTRCVKVPYLSNGAPAEHDAEAGPDLHVQLEVAEVWKGFVQDAVELGVGSNSRIWTRIGGDTRSIHT